MQEQSAPYASYHNQTDHQNDDREFRDAAHLAWRVEVVAALEAAGYAKEADLFARCADPAQFFTVDYNASLPEGMLGVFVCEADPHHHSKAIAPMCRLRICPDCAHQQTARLLNHYVPILLDLENAGSDEYSVKHIVLTTPISLDDLDVKDQVHELQKRITEVFDTVAGKKWREDSGLLVAYEFGELGRKLHFHAIWYGAYLPHAELVEAWKTVTGGRASVVWIERVSAYDEGGRSLESAVAEVAKYATKLAHKNKDGTWRWMPAADVVKLFTVLKGSRRIRSYGLLYGNTPEKKPHLCPVCAATMIKLKPLEWDIWRETGWLPEEFDAAIRPSLLQYIIGNNSSGLPPPENNEFQCFQPALPTLERYTTRQQWLDMVK